MEKLKGTNKMTRPHSPAHTVPNIIELIKFGVWVGEWKGTTCYMNWEDQKCLQNF